MEDFKEMLEDADQAVQTAEDNLKKAQEARELMKAELENLQALSEKGGLL